jgi:hypothetical protein
MTDMGVCACTGCEHHVSSEQAAIIEGRAYCCQACAAGHAGGSDCVHKGCPCSELNRPDPDEESTGEEVMEGFSNAQF